MLWKLCSAVVLLASAAVPMSARAESPDAGSSTAAQGWTVSATLTCQRTETNADLCNRLLGPLTRLDINIRVDKDYLVPGIVFESTYTGQSSAFAAEKVCAFGVFFDRLRVIPRTPGSNCKVTSRGRMAFRVGAATRSTGSPDFWITQETATVVGSPTLRNRLDPLAKGKALAKTYPVDTRFPVNTRGGVQQFNTAEYLRILGLGQFASPPPSGVRVSVAVSQPPLVGH